MDPTVDWERWRRVLSGEPLPAAVVDLDALDHNQDLILDRLGEAGPTLRMASKSIRVPAILRYLLDRARATASVDRPSFGPGAHGVSSHANTATGNTGSS
ncbi:MAG: hypothetical protein ACQEXJ_24655 [Myxococcota bacterium]